MATVYKIIGKYKNQPSEEIDETDSWANAISLLHEYSIAFGQDFKLTIKKTYNKAVHDFCPKCGCHFITHNSDGSCVKD